MTLAHCQVTHRVAPTEWTPKWWIRFDRPSGAVAGVL
jgi:hypothetical protein